MWITWKHEDTDFATALTFEQKVEVFYEQTLGWQLHIADIVANGGTTFGEFKRGEHGYEVRNIRHAGFAGTPYLPELHRIDWVAHWRDAVVDENVRDRPPSDTRAHRQLADYKDSRSPALPRGSMRPVS